MYGAGFSLVGITLRSLVIQRKEDHWLHFGILMKLLIEQKVALSAQAEQQISVKVSKKFASYQ